jgi:hypothetical protein
VFRLGVPEEISALEHPCCGFDGRCVERDDSVARLDLAPSNVHEALDEIHIAPANVFHLDWPHRRVGRHDRSAVNVLPLRTRGGDVEQAAPLLRRQRAADGPLALWQVLDVISERPPPAAELQHPRQHAHIHVNRAIGNAGVVTDALEISDCRSCDCGERHVAEVFLDDAEPLLLELDRAR